MSAYEVEALKCAYLVGSLGNYSEDILRTLGKKNFAVGPPGYSVQVA